MNTHESNAPADTFVLFAVAGTTYALRSRDVEHIEMIESVTRVPNAPPFVDGVVFSRGEVVAAVNLRARFGFERAPYDVRTRLIVVRSGSRALALVADEGREFVTIPAASIQPPHETLADLGAAYIAGVARLGDRLIVILDLAQLLAFTDAVTAA